MKVDADPEPKVVDEPNPESDVKDPLIETHVDLPAEPSMKLSSPAMSVLLSLRSPGVYDPLHIFLESTGSQEVELLMVQNTIGPIFKGENLPRHVSGVLFKILSIVAGWSRKLVPPPPP